MYFSQALNQSTTLILNLIPVPFLHPRFPSDRDIFTGVLFSAEPYFLMFTLNGEMIGCFWCGFMMVESYKTEYFMVSGSGYLVDVDDDVDVEMFFTLLWFRRCSDSTVVHIFGRVHTVSITSIRSTES